MKILYIVKNALDDTATAMLEQHKRDVDVDAIMLADNKNYADIIKAVFDSDKVICW